MISENGQDSNKRIIKKNLNEIFLAGYLYIRKKAPSTRYSGGVVLSRYPSRAADRSFVFFVLCKMPLSVLEARIKKMFDAYEKLYGLYGLCGLGFSEFRSAVLQFLSFSWPSSCFFRYLQLLDGGSS